MRYFHWSLLASGVVAAALSGCKSDEKPKEPASVVAEAPQPPLSVHDSIDVSITAKVMALDYASRVVTLQDEDGHQVTFSVDPMVKRLNEVRVGDEVTARYRAHLIAELRAPTAEETANPISVVSLAGRAPGDESPAGGAAQGVRVVTTVAAVDLPNMLVTLRGPMDDLAVVRGRKPENVKRLHVGDTIVITYTESVAISLEKVTPR